MVKTGLINRLDLLSLKQKTALDAERQTPEAEINKQLNKDIYMQIKEIGKDGDIDTILAAELKILENEYALHSNNRVMDGSLEIAIIEAKATVALLPKVKSMESYRSVDESFSLPKNRLNDIPRDEARQFFKSHNARLLNLNKSRLSPEEKKIIDIRRNNIRIAGKIYIAQQKQILGIAAKTNKKLDNQLGL